MPFAPHSKIVFIGDSITDADRARPIGEGLFNALGTGFVRDIDALIQATYPERKIRIVNMGTSGNTVLDLKSRWDTDLVNLNPNIVVITIGINDVWRQFDSPFKVEEHVLLPKYKETLEGLVDHTLKTGAQVILQTPFYIEPLRQDLMRAKMDDYGEAVKRIAVSHQLKIVDTQAAFDRELTHHHSSYLAWDRVHPTPVGTMILARAFLETVGFEWKPAESH